MSDYGRLMEENETLRRRVAELNAYIDHLTSAMNASDPERSAPDPMNAPEPAV